MKAAYWQKGEALDYVNNTKKKIENGEVVILGNRIGIAGDDMQPGSAGVMHVTGVFSFDKDGQEAITLGTDVYLSDAGITATAGGVKAGYAAADSPAESSKVYVKINA
ncbi:MAG: DUF2190 family protein [Lachnospiraceae bacterium]|nr:DUF2190 family protein [Lachnospiraceae bacterium]